MNPASSRKDFGWVTAKFTGSPWPHKTCSIIMIVIPWQLIPVAIPVASPKTPPTPPPKLLRPPQHSFALPKLLRPPPNSSDPPTPPPPKSPPTPSQNSFDPPKTHPNSQKLLRPPQFSSDSPPKLLRPLPNSSNTPFPRPCK